MKEVKQGKVYLVGAGPGDVELITVKGYNVLRKADVINIDLLKGLTAETIFVGKKKKIHYYTQEEINDLLVKFAKSGKTVVRLKGGDPLIFGRGAEEITALVKNGIDFEIVPGLTSGTSVASGIGLPLTHRDLSSSIAIITGHRKNDGEDSRSLPKADTLVFLMGLSALDKIVEDLLVEGFDKDSKVAVISKGSLKDERYVSGRLDEIVNLVEKSKMASPAIVIYGKVVNWYDDMLKSRCSEKEKALLNNFASNLF